VALTTDPAPVKPPDVPAQPTDCNAVNGYNWNTRTAYAICMAESGGDPAKDNAGLNADGSVDYGLMQVNSIHADMVGGNLEALRNPAVNIKIAYSLSKGGTDWTPWSTYNNGKYREWL
jgi:hypothetical protein